MIAVHTDIESQTRQGLQVLKLFRNDALELLRLSLEMDAVFPGHSSPTEAVLPELEGRTRFHNNTGECCPGPQIFPGFPAKTPDRVQADQPSKFLIIG